jgi:hypothetical protein
MASTPLKLFSGASAKPCGMLWPNASASLRALHQPGKIHPISSLPARAAHPPAAYTNLKEGLHDAGNRKVVQRPKGFRFYPTRRSSSCTSARSNAPGSVASTRPHDPRLVRTLGRPTVRSLLKVARLTSMCHLIGSMRSFLMPNGLARVARVWQSGPSGRVEQAFADRLVYATEKNREIPDARASKR